VSNVSPDAVGSAVNETRVGTGVLDMILIMSAVPENALCSVGSEPV